MNATIHPDTPMEPTLRVHVALPKAVVEAIDHQVGQRNRSRFLTAAAEREISRRDLVEAAHEEAVFPALTSFETIRASVPPLSHPPSEEAFADALDEARTHRQRRAQAQDPAE